VIRLDSRIALQDTKKRSLDKSLFFQRLKDIIGKHRNNEELKNELENIKKTVKTVVKNGSIISQRIIEILPHFTLHNETHFFNVLAFMEQLVPESTMDKLCAVECALAILSAFTHDIAMAISLEEKNKITGLAGKECDEHKAFLDFCNGRKKLLEVKEQLENRLLSSSSKEDIVWRIEALKQRLLGDYIRSTHSHEEIGFNRIHKWLDALEKDNPITFTYNRLDLKPLLCFLDVSHGQSMNWIEEAMVKKGYKKNDVYEMHSTDGTVNLAYLSWILHLADLLDCDSSRTPPVIYHHIGITDHVSKEHWEKHLSVHTIDFRKKKETGNVNLVFISHSCSGPIIHKMILDHVNYVNYQLNEIRTAMHTAPYGDKEKYMLNLPVRAGSDIQEQRDMKRINAHTYITISALNWLRMRL
jgi:molecular chaperone HtpG